MRAKFTSNHHNRFSFIMSSDNSQSLWNKMFIVKLSQGLLSVLVLILCTYDVTIMSFNGCEFAIFTVRA